MGKPKWSWDTNGRHEWRYHDGENWTDHVSDNGVVSTDTYDPEFTPEHLAVFQRAEYLGGHAGLGEPRRGTLFISSEAIGIGDISHGSARIPISDVASVELAGGQVTVSRVTNVLAFGILGLASKGSKCQASLGVRTSGGEIGYYLIDQAEPMRVRAQLTTVFASLKVPFGDAAP